MLRMRHGQVEFCPGHDAFAEGKGRPVLSHAERAACCAVARERFLAVPGPRDSDLYARLLDEEIRRVTDRRKIRPAED